MRMAWRGVRSRFGGNFSSEGWRDKKANVGGSSEDLEGQRGGDGVRCDKKRIWNMRVEEIGTVVGEEGSER